MWLARFRATSAVYAKVCHFCHPARRLQLVEEGAVELGDGADVGDLAIKDSGVYLHI